MKHIIAEHAVAIGKPFVKHDTELQMYHCEESGLLFALDGAFLEDQDEETPLSIPSFVNEGKAIVLVDSKKEINPNIKAVGENHPEKLIDKAIGEISKDIEMGDWSAIAEMLQFLPKEVLNNYLGIN